MLLVPMQPAIGTLCPILGNFRMRCAKRTPSPQDAATATHLAEIGRVSRRAVVTCHVIVAAYLLGTSCSLTCECIHITWMRAMLHVLYASCDCPSRLNC